MTVDIVEDAANHLDAILADRDGLHITGRVVDQRGQPVRYARVEIDLRLGVTVEPDGGFALRDLTAGSYRVTAMTMSRKLGCETEIVAGAPTATLVVGPRDGDDGTGPYPPCTSG